MRSVRASASRQRPNGAGLSIRLRGISYDMGRNPPVCSDHGQMGGYGRRMAKLGVSREVLAGMLRRYGEDELAGRALSLSDDELARIGTLGAYYAFSEDAMALGGSMGGSRALSLATIDVLENTQRDLRWGRNEWERDESAFDRFAEHDVLRDRELRRHAAEQQIPADESKRTLDTVDPPPWGPAPPDATPPIKRCHELRSKPLMDLTVEDLRIMIAQQVALGPLVALSLDRLQPDVLVGDDFPGDLLASVLRVNGAFWERFPDLDVEVRRLAERLYGRLDLTPELRELIETFIRDHSTRRIALRARLATSAPLP
jgi:hypothetical protein